VGVRRHWRTRPDIHEAHHLAHDRESVARVAPPMVAIEWIFVSRVNEYR
jgi:hypothetical protein